MTEPPKRNPAASKLTGWTILSGVLLLVAGVLNLFNGVTALDHGGFYSTHLLIDRNLTFWGWAFIVWGVLELAAGGLVLSRKALGPFVGIALAGLAAALWFMLIFSAPFASLVGIGLNILVIYGLTARLNTDLY